MRAAVKTWPLTALIPALAGGLIATAASAQTPAPDPVIDPTTQLFCKDDLGEINPIPYVSLGTIMRKFEARYHFILTARKDLSVLIFSNTESPYSITYQSMPYKDQNGHAGIALLSAHIALENTEDDFKGTGMCYFTAFSK